MYTKQYKIDKGAWPLTIFKNFFSESQIQPAQKIRLDETILMVLLLSRSDIKKAGFGDFEVLESYMERFEFVILTMINQSTIAPPGGRIFMKLDLIYIKSMSSFPLNHFSNRLEILTSRLCPSENQLKFFNDRK